MSLVLHLDSNDPALREVAGRRVEVASRMTIGRGSDNDLVLPDPNRHLSKNHCTIAFDGRGYTITDTSTNGVFLNNGPETPAARRADAAHRGQRSAGRQLRDDRRGDRTSRSGGLADGAFPSIGKPG